MLYGLFWWNDNQKHERVDSGTAFELTEKQKDALEECFDSHGNISLRELSKGTEWQEDDDE